MPRTPIFLRRCLFALIATAAASVLTVLLLRALMPGGWTGAKVAMFASFLGTVPWTGICAANGVIGFCLLVFARDPVRATFPVEDRLPFAGPPPRTAIALTIRNEDMESVLPAMRRLLDGLDTLDAQAAANGRADPLACEGAMPLYAIPERAVDHVPVALPLPTGRMRGNAQAYAAFMTESFVDECAHFANAEPLAFRVGMLSGQPRMVECLQGVARMAMWGGGADASGQGIACHRMDLAAPEGIRAGYIAVVATARTQDGTIRVDQLSAYVDIGRVVNMDIARQQIEGGLMFGLAQAVGGSTAYQAGLPTAGRLSQLGLPLLADCPKVDIAFADSDAQPFDPGEIGVVAVAPAIANALFSATGLRLRRLPLLSEGL